jgi:hypothetical protein
MVKWRRYQRSIYDLNHLENVMKICPACNESFTDEFSFCELDGTKLKRQGGAAGEPAAKKDWSLLGLALVLGAVLITVATIIFAPKARFSASTTNSDSVAVAKLPQTTPSTSAVIDQTPSAGTDTPPDATADETLPTTEIKKKEKIAKTETDEAAANAKAAATDPDANSKAAKAAVQPAEQPPAAKTEPVAIETKEPEARPRTVTPPAETKEIKKPVESKPVEKEADTKKKDDKKKKGGFFGVFKKIFGKDGN